MNETVKSFFEREKQFVTRCDVLPNGVRYIIDKGENLTLQRKIYHTSYNPLTDKEIDFLEKDVNDELSCNYVFPEWYRDFLKTTNGCNLFFSSLCLFAEQTPWVWIEKWQSWGRALIDGRNPQWMAPYNLRNPHSIKLDPFSRLRWLTIGQYPDATSVDWDYKGNQIVAMYPIEKSLSIKERKSLKEADFERMICARWDSFDEFFRQETERLKGVMKQFDYNKDRYWENWQKTLPVGHKDYQE